jgi:hypothetical protein
MLAFRLAAFGGHFMRSMYAQRRLLREKFSSPLFAVSIRLFAKRRTVFEQLLGWAEQFAAPPQQRLVINQSEWNDSHLPDYERSWLGLSAVARCTHRPGLLLNLNELASLVHLPGKAVVSERLRRVATRTRPAASTPAEAGSVRLGVNVHRGERRVARLPAARSTSSRTTSARRPGHRPATAISTPPLPKTRFDTHLWKSLAVGRLKINTARLMPARYRKGKAIACASTSLDKSQKIAASTALRIIEGGRASLSTIFANSAGVSLDKIDHAILLRLIG